MEEIREWVKSGYLMEKFRLFHLKDNEPREYEYHYHDFHKLIWFISGEVEYHIEGKSYKLEPHDILLVNKGEIHKPFVENSAYMRDMSFTFPANTLTSIPKRKAAWIYAFPCPERKTGMWSGPPRR